MKKVFTFVIFAFLALSCRDEETIAPGNSSDAVKIEPLVDSDDFILKEVDSPVEFSEVIEFNNNYIFGGFGGFVITDQNLNVRDTYEENWIVYHLINYNDDFVCICANQGIFKVDQSLTTTKLIDLPCTDIAIDESGEILFISGLGELSKQRQISANILVLDVDEQRFDFYSDPTDSIGEFLQQIEILSNGEIFTLSISTSVFQYQDKNVAAKYSQENVDFYRKINRV